MEEELDKNIFYYHEEPVSNKPRDKYTLYYQSYKTRKIGNRTNIRSNNYNFVEKLSMLPPTEIFPFLEFHYNKYKGNPKDFIRNTSSLDIGGSTSKGQLILASVNDWLEEKTEYLKNKSFSESIKVSNLQKGSLITDRQQGMVSYYLDKAFGIRGTDTKADYNRFVLWYLGIGAEKVNTHNITKKYLRQPATANGESIRSLESIILDVEIVRSEFNKINCVPVLKIIDKDLSKLKTQLADIKPS